ncbi:MAG: hypothetical protein JXO22_13140 [Phycisphaerae bacterium]|nr:hypothetical protein [Phycisphaerae bacterium]
MTTGQSEAHQTEPMSDLSLWRQLRNTPLHDLLSGRLTSRLDYRGVYSNPNCLQGNSARDSRAC